MPAKLYPIINTEVEISISGKEIADLFWQLDADEQCEFFNRLGSFTKLPFQLQGVTDCKDLKHEGRLAMNRIGEYSEKN